MTARFTAPACVCRHCGDTYQPIIDNHRFLEPFEGVCSCGAMKWGSDGWNFWVLDKTIKMECLIDGVRA